jgi:hypothetical protein
MKRSLVAILVLALATGLALADDRWLHIRVQERGLGDEEISINVPLQLVEALLPTIQAEGLDHGKVHWRHHSDLDGIDLREILAALRDAPDAEFVTVRSRDESVRVAKDGGYLLIHVDETDGERVRVKMPLAVIDAMLSTDEEELDLVAALRALADYDVGDLVTVESDDSFVRIWIDSSDAGE